MYAAILAGGTGTRFWPLSRETTPKQLLKVVGDETMIQQTVSRLNDVMPVKNIYIITDKKYVFDIKNQTDQVGCAGLQIIAEPAARNTAPAIGLAALHIRKRSSEAVMAVMPSDHVVTRPEAFRRVIAQAAAVARKGYLTTIGVVPSRAETGYGYIQRGASLGRNDGIEGFRVQRFVEKPDAATARKYLKSGQYFWNSGIFVWRVKDILAEIQKQMPDLHQGLLKIGKALGTKKEGVVMKEVFTGLSAVSIDYGVMEKAAKVAVISADIGWCDMGSWLALDEVSRKDAAGNVISGNVIDIGSKNSIVYAGSRLVATIGLQDTVVVDTPDATLICSKERTQDVRKVVDELRRKGADELVEHVTVTRPWGSYTVLEVGPRYKIKRIVVNPGAKLSHQLHHHRSEHWVVVAGTARVTVGEKTYNVHPNESTYVPMSTVHRLENPGRLPLQLIEVQNGDYTAEDDIVRMDDEYGR